MHIQSLRLRKKSVTGLLLTLLLSCLLQLSQAQTIMVHGDSLSAGYGLQEHERWVTLLGQKLGPDHEVLNTSISGETTRGGLERLPVLLSTVKPDVVILALGANDGLRGFTVDSMKANLQSMVDMSQRIGAEVIVVGMRLPPNMGKRYAEPFFLSFKEVAEASGSVYLPFLLENVVLKEDLWQQDGLHPNATAQPIILNDVLPLVKEVLSKS